MPVNIPEMQREHRAWIEHNFPLTAVYGDQRGTDVDGLLGMVEEVGELAHAVLKYEQGVRVLSEAEFREKVKDALGDIFVYMMSFANRNGVDLDHAISATWQEVRSRDWRADPQGGRPARFTT